MSLFQSVLDNQLRAAAPAPVTARAFVEQGTGEHGDTRGGKGEGILIAGQAQKDGARNLADFSDSDAGHDDEHGDDDDDDNYNEDEHGDLFVNTGGGGDAACDSLSDDLEEDFYGSD